MQFEKDTLTDMFDYLDGLRDGECVNMFGAGPYLCDYFSIRRKESHKVLAAWQNTFGQGTAAARADLAIAASAD